MSPTENNSVPDQALPPGALPEEEYRKLVERANAEYSLEPTEDDHRYWDDFAWAENNPEFKERYTGKWLAIYKRELLAVGEDQIALLDEAERKSGLPRNTITVVMIPDESDWLYWDPKCCEPPFPT